MSRSSYDGSITINTFVDTAGISKGLNSISGKVQNISRTLNVIAGFTGFVALSESALAASSSLTEVRNVAEVTFGNMISKLDEFNSKSIESYGMSELMATEAASSFMAMGNSMGFARDQASDMAIRLTELTADFASFYNISQDRARIALSAVYTGETETMKQYGILLTEVNLQQYENTYGLGRNVKTMAAAEKALLRYNYVLKATVNAQGDFARTSGSWANQLRILKEMWRQFMIVIGTTLTAILLPALKTMNAAISVMINWANALNLALANIFGIDFNKITQASSGVSDASSGMEDMANATEDVAGATEDANKELKKYLGNYDELNVIQKNIVGQSEDVSDSLGDITPEITPSTGSGLVSSIKEKVESDIDTLFELGHKISQTLTKMMNDIDWDAIYKKAENFGNGLAQFLNGLITVEAFQAVGRTLAGVLNTVIVASLKFVKTFEWYNFGRALEAGLTAYVKKLKLNEAAEALARAIMGIVDMANGFMDAYEFGTIGKKIADAINTFFYNFDGKEFGKALNKFVSGLITELNVFLTNVDWKEVIKDGIEFLGELDIGTLFLVGSVVLSKILGFSVAGAVIQTIGGALIKSLGGYLSIALGDMLAKLFGSSTLQGLGIGAVLIEFGKFAAKTIGWGFKSMFGSELASGMLSGLRALSPLFTEFLGGGSIIGGAILSIKSFIDAITNGLNWLNALGMGVGDILIGLGLVIAGVVTGPVGLLIAGIIFAIQLFVTWFVELMGGWESFQQYWITGIQLIGQWFIDIWNGIAEFFGGLIAGIQGAWDGFVGWISQTWQGFVDFWNVTVEFFSNTWEAVIFFFQTLWDTFIGWISEKWEGFKQTWQTGIDTIKQWWDNLCKTISDIWNAIWGPIKAAWDGFTQAWQIGIEGARQAWQTFSNTVVNIFNGIMAPIRGVIDTVKGWIDGIIGSIQWLQQKISSIRMPSFSFGSSTTRTYSTSGLSTASYSVPALANGAVIPSNNPFLAMLGDQKKGTNIEAPLDTIKQALSEVMEKVTPAQQGDIIIEIDGKEVFKAVRTQNTSYKKQTGVSAF